MTPTAAIKPYQPGNQATDPGFVDLGPARGVHVTEGAGGYVAASFLLPDGVALLGGEVSVRLAFPIMRGAKPEDDRQYVHFWPRCRLAAMDQDGGLLVVLAAGRDDGGRVYEREPRGPGQLIEV